MILRKSKMPVMELSMPLMVMDSLPLLPRVLVVALMQKLVRWGLVLLELRWIQWMPRARWLLNFAQ